MPLASSSQLLQYNIFLIFIPKSPEYNATRFKFTITSIQYLSHIHTKITRIQCHSLQVHNYFNTISFSYSYQNHQNTMPLASSSQLLQYNIFLIFIPKSPEHNATRF